MLDFRKFLEEASLKGNLGVPGENNDKKSDKKYLSDVERKADRDFIQPARPAAIVNGPMGPMPNRQMIERMQNFMRLVGEVMKIQNPRNLNNSRINTEEENKLQEFAKELIMSIYEPILRGIELDIQFMKQGNKPDMEEAEQPPPQKEIKNLILKLEVDKRKIINNIIQGEAKNTKTIIAMQECKDGLIEILGQRNGTRYHDLLLEITKIASENDWIWPIEQVRQMWKDAPEGFSGFVKVEKKEEEEDQEEDQEEEKDTREEPEEIEKEEVIAEIVIRARGLDFAMLIHETVKGIMETYSSSGLPEEGVMLDGETESLRDLVIKNCDTLFDEAEDLRYGPYIAGDLRDFVFSSKHLSKMDIEELNSKYPNMREFVFGRLVQVKAKEFLDIIFGLFEMKGSDPYSLDQPESTKKTRKWFDDEIKKIIDQWDEFYKPEESEYLDDDQYDNTDSEMDDVLYPEDDKAEKEPEQEKELDYSNMSKRELNDALNDALDRGDRTALDKISKILQTKESVMWKVYGTDINRILKNK